jgi:hypothetical protein
MIIGQIKKSDIRQSSREYLFALLLCGLILIWSFELWKHDLTIPISYSGDALDVGVRIKGIIDNGWVGGVNNYIGMPYGQSMVGMPLFNSLNYFLIKLISYFTPGYALTMNIWYLLTFPLTTVTTLFVFRQFKMPFRYAVVGSLLYTFTPFHFFRNVTHLDYSSYFLLPLLIMVTLWIFEEKPIFFQYDERIKRKKFILINSPTLISIVICGLIAGIDIQYAFYSCFFLLIAGIVVSFSKKNKYSLLSSVVLIGIIILGVSVYLIPASISNYESGYGLSPISPGYHPADPAESEIYGLKIIQLLIPHEGHIIPYFENFTAHYDLTAPLVNENSWASLGIIGGIGFIILLFWVFFRLVQYKTEEKNYYFILLNGLAVLNLSALLLSTVGGFGSLFSYLIPYFASFRDYNRISIFIAFFSLFAFFLIMLISMDHLSKRKYYNFICFLILSGILIFGIMDQISDPYKTSIVSTDGTTDTLAGYNETFHEYLNDENFIQQIEAKGPDDSMIFQLPYIAYPWGGRTNKLSEYELFKGYLHSRQFRWSYGAIRGTTGDIWQREVSKASPQELIKLLALAGFNGVYIDSYGYSDNGSYILSSLSEFLETKPIVSNNSRLYFFDMTQYNQKFLANKSNVSYPFSLNGGYGKENWSGSITQWINDNATIAIYSGANHTARVEFLALSFIRPKTLEIVTGQEQGFKGSVPPYYIPISIPLKLRKGENLIRFHVLDQGERGIDIPGLNSTDTRSLTVAIQNISVSLDGDLS